MPAGEIDMLLPGAAEGETSDVLRTLQGIPQYRLEGLRSRSRRRAPFHLVKRGRNAHLALRQLRGFVGRARGDDRDPAEAFGARSYGLQRQYAVGADAGCRCRTAAAVTANCRLDPQPEP